MKKNLINYPKLQSKKKLSPILIKYLSLKNLNLTFPKKFYCLKDFYEHARSNSKCFEKEIDSNRNKYGFIQNSKV